MKIDVFDTTGKKLTPIEVNPNDFGTKVNKNLLAQALRIYTSNTHQNTSKVKTRGEITGSTRKIYRQKGTGRARHGDRYAPIFVGGGVAHGPTGARSKNLVLPKRMKRKALGSIILQKLDEKAISALDKIDTLKISTSGAAKLYSKAANHPKNKVLVITGNKQDKLYKSSQNLQGVTLKRASLVNTKDIALADYLLVTKNAISILKNRVSGKQPEQPQKLTTEKPSAPKKPAPKATKKEAK